MVIVWVPLRIGKSIRVTGRVKIGLVLGLGTCLVLETGFTSE